ncbi:hypothetical protein D9M68_514010 [compost metagenome]
MGVVEAVQWRGDATVEVQEGTHALQRAEAFQGGEVFRLAVVGEQVLLAFHVGHHLAHEMRLVDPGETEGDAVGALVQAIGHRDRHGALQAAAFTGFPEVLEQHIAAQRVAHRVERRQWTAGAQVADGGCQVFADARVVAPGQQVGLARTAAPVEGDAGPAAIGQFLLQAEHIVRGGRSGQAVQDQHQGRIGLVGAMPVQVEEVAVLQPQAFTLSFQRRRRAAEG